MGDPLDERLGSLERRIRTLEDEREILRLIVGYGLAVDVGDGDAAAQTFTEDGVYDVDVGTMTGRDAVRAMVQGERHRSMVGRCAHQIGPATIEIDGDRATAVGYSRVYLAGPAGIHVYRVSANRWELRRERDGWRIERRTTRILGHPEALLVLRSEPA
jgi:ketosteroid isomerase-like protein